MTLEVVRRYRQNVVESFIYIHTCRQFMSWFVVDTNYHNIRDFGVLCQRALVSTSDRGQPRIKLNQNLVEDTPTLETFTCNVHLAAFNSRKNGAVPCIGSRVGVRLYRSYYSQRYQTNTKESSAADIPELQKHYQLCLWRAMPAAFVWVGFSALLTCAILLREAEYQE